VVVSDGRRYLISTDRRTDLLRRPDKFSGPPRIRRNHVRDIRPPSGGRRRQVCSAARPALAAAFGLELSDERTSLPRPA